MFNGRDENPDIKNLENIASILRHNVLIALCKAGSGHPGGALSAADFFAALYFAELRHDPKNPKWQGRDRVFLSKGHACPILYASLAESGYFPQEELKKLRKIDSMLQGHPHMEKTPGVEVSSGSLGHGLGIANGCAMALRMDSNDARVYVALGDGEIQEGSVWEAIMTSAHRKLDNIFLWVDSNNLQIDGKVEDVKGVMPLADKFKAFNWHVIEIDGNSIEQNIKAFKEARTVKGKPTCVVAKTVKGKGVCFMENKAEWHGVAPNKEQLDAALKDICIIAGPTRKQLEYADA
jgi:transketolase